MSAVWNSSVSSGSGEGKIRETRDRARCLRSLRRGDVAGTAEAMVAPRPVRLAAARPRQWPAGTDVGIQLRRDAPGRASLRICLGVSVLSSLMVRTTGNPIVRGARGTG